MEEHSDADLMAKVRDGDYCAFDEIYRRYSGRLRRFLFSLTWDQDTAEDYLQETFARLYRARHRYEPTGSFATFIFRIAKNYYLTQRRRAKRRPEEASLDHLSTDGRKSFENIPANQSIEPEIHLVAEYQKYRIRQAVMSLPEDLKMVFVLCHFEDLKYVDIAELLGIPVGTVKSRMFRAVSTLRSVFQEEPL
jgi:RNA polymerase sigma-70 factor, ECF subfamily